MFSGPYTVSSSFACTLAVEAVGVGWRKQEGLAPSAGYLGRAAAVPGQRGGSRGCSLVQIFVPFSQTRFGSNRQPRIPFFEPTSKTSC